MININKYAIILIRMKVTFMNLFRKKYINKISKNKVSKKKVKVKTINKIEKPGKYLKDIIEKRYLGNLNI